MSSKGHFLNEDGIEGYEETNEPRSIFGQFKGFDAYLCLEPSVLESFKVKEEFFYIETKNTDKLPKKLKIWCSAIEEIEWDEWGLSIHFKGGHHITKNLINKKFTNLASE